MNHTLLFTRPTRVNLMLVFLFFLPLVLSSTHFISPSGNDAASCSILSPCRTLSHVFDLLSTNDVIILEEGEYGPDGFHSLDFGDVQKGILNVTLSSNNATINLGGYRFLSVFDDVEGERRPFLKIDGLNFVGGKCEDDGGYEGGGVMRIEGRFEVSFRNCQFIGNECHVGTSAFGGALYLSESEVVIENCIFRNNAAMNESGDGGAIGGYHVSLSIVDSLFDGNIAMRQAGAIRTTSDSNVTISNTLFVRNMGTPASAVSIWGNSDAVVRVEGCVFIENSLISPVPNLNRAAGATLFIDSMGAVVDNCYFGNNTGVATFVFRKAGCLLTNSYFSNNEGEFIRSINYRGEDTDPPNTISECVFEENIGYSSCSHPANFKNCKFISNTHSDISSSLFVGGFNISSCEFISNRAVSLVYAKESSTIETSTFQSNSFDFLIETDPLSLPVHVHLSDLDFFESSEILRIQNVICTVKNVSLGDVHIEKEGTMIIHQNTTISHLDITDGVVILEDEGINLSIRDGFVWSGGEIKSSSPDNVISCEGGCHLILQILKLGDGVILELRGTKSIEEGRLGNSMLLDGEVVVYDELSLPVGAKICGEGEMVLESGSSLDFTSTSSVSLSVNLTMKKNSTMVFQVQQRPFPPLHLKKGNESDFTNGKLSLISAPRDIEEGETFLLFEYDFPPHPFLLTEWENRLFDLEYNATGVSVTFNGYIVEETFLSSSDTFFILMVVLVVIGILLICFLIIFTILQRTQEIFKASTPALLVLFLCGGFLALIGSFFWILEPSGAICELRVWLPAVAFILLLGPLLTKTYRLHRLFSEKSLEIIKIPTLRLFQFILVALVIQILLLSLWSGISPNKAGGHEIINEDDGTRTVHLLCTTKSQIFLSPLIVYNVILCVAGAFLAFKARKLPTLYNESKWIAISIYNFMTWGILLVILGYSLSGNILFYQGLISFGIFFVTLSTTAMIFFPKLYLYHTMRGMSQSEIIKMKTGFIHSSPPTSTTSLPAKANISKYQRKYQKYKKKYIALKNKQKHKLIGETELKADTKQ